MNVNDEQLIESRTERRWTDLGWWERTTLLVGSRSPESSATARAALEQARHLRARSMLTAALGGAGGAVVWITLSLLVGDAGEAQSWLGWLLPAVLFGAIFFLTHLWLSRRQADRLERQARSVIESSGP